MFDSMHRIHDICTRLVIFCLLLYLD